MSNHGASRVSIPNNVRKTIQNIKEITSNHSEEDIYAMLKECSMDPNETTQRLLHLDTFHEVKRKRDKKELQNVKGRSAEEPRWKPGHQWRGTRGARGSSYSRHTSNDAGGRRNAATQKENGVEERREKGFRHPPVPISKETDSIQSPNVEESSTIMDGPGKVPNGSLSGVHGSQNSGVSYANVSKENTDARVDISSSMITNAIEEHAPSASDPVLVPSRDSRVPTIVGAVKREVHIQRISTEPNAPVAVDRGLGTPPSVSNNHVNKRYPQNEDESEVPSSIIEKEASGHINVAQQKILLESPAPEKIQLPDSSVVVKSSSPRVIGPLEGLEEATSKIDKLRVSDGQHVIIPNHIQVPDAVKNVLNFGSLDANFGVGENFVNSGNDKNSDPASDTADDEIASRPSSGDQDAVSTAPEGKYVQLPQSPIILPGQISPSDMKVSSSATVPKDDQLKEETWPAVNPPFPVVQTTPSYSFGFVPPMLGNPLVQVEGFESQAHVSNSLNWSSPAMTPPASTPPLTQSIGAGQSSIAVSPLPVPLFRQPYPHNYNPYSHYFSPFYVPPTMHQYFGHAAFPPQLPTGNVYLTPSATAAALKISPGPYKPGANWANQAPVSLLSGYGVFSSSQVGYSHNTAVTSGNSSTSEDLLPSALKESNMYPGQQNGGSTVWLPATGQDTASFPLNSFSNIPPQGQHIIAPHSGHGAFAIYHSLQPIATPPPGQPLVHQSQPTAGTVESVGPPSNACQQQSQRHQLINWNM